MSPSNESKSTTSPNNNQIIQNYMYEKSLEFGIGSSGTRRGECKYCSLLNIDLAELGAELKHSLDHYIKKCLKSNQEYAKIITRIQIENSANYLKLEDDGANANAGNNNQILSLNKRLLKHLPNLSSITCKNVRILEMDSSLGRCINLRSLELVNNGLTHLKAELFDLTNETNKSNLTQILIDNNPLIEVSATIFGLESLRSIIFTRLALQELPDSWLNDEWPEICVRTIFVAQTKLQRLPKDLILGNANSLEQLTFQGYI